MSGTTRVGMDFGKTYIRIICSPRSGKASLISIKIREIMNRIEEKFSQDSFGILVLDVVQVAELLDIVKIGNNIMESIKNERFSRKYTLNDAGRNVAALPYQPADIRISSSFPKSDILSKISCENEDNQFSRQNAMEKQSNELSEFSISMAAHLWRDRRHRRIRIYNLWIAP